MKKPIRILFLTSLLLFFAGCNVVQEPGPTAEEDTATVQQGEESAAESEESATVPEAESPAPAAEPVARPERPSVVRPAIEIERPSAVRPTIALDRPVVVRPQVPEMRPAHLVPPVALNHPVREAADVPELVEEQVATATCDVAVESGACELDRDSIVFQLNRDRPANTPQRVIIESIDFEDDAITVRNVSDSDLVFAASTSGRRSPWRVAAGNQGARTPLPDGFALAAGARVRIHLTASGEDDCANIYLAWSHPAANLSPDLEQGSEVAVLSPYG